MEEVNDDVFIEAEVKKADAERAAELARLRKEREDAAAKEEKEKAENEKKKKELRKKIAKCLIAIAAGIAAIVIAKKIINTMKNKKAKETAAYVEEAEKAIEKLEEELKANEKLLKKFDAKIKTPGLLKNNEYEQVMDLISESQKKAKQAIKLRTAANKKLGYSGTDASKGTEDLKKKLSKLNQKEDTAKGNFKAHVTWWNKPTLGKHTKEWIEDQKEAKARAKSANGNIFSRAAAAVAGKIEGGVTKATSKSEAKARVATLEKQVKELAKNMKNAKEFNTTKERDQYVSIYNAWIDLMNASGDSRKDLDKITKDGKLGFKYETVEVDNEILKAMVYKEFINYTTESEFDYLNSLVDAGCDILNELAYETYTPVMNSIEKAYMEGTIDKYQYDDLYVTALERMSNEYLICG